MQEIEITRGVVRELQEIDTALRETLGAVYTGAVMNDETIRLILADTASKTDLAQARSLALSEIAKIDVKAPPPSARARQRLEKAHTDLRGMDFAGLHGRIEAANSVQALRTEVRTLMRLVQQMAQAQGLTDADLPDDTGV